ncbi:MAG: hypothetical protein OCD76_15890 [Reichenbachiella sp.]
MNKPSNNSVKVFLILIGVMVAVFIGYTSNAVPVANDTKIAMSEMLPISLILDAVHDVLGNTTSFISGILNR